MHTKCAVTLSPNKLLYSVWSPHPYRWAGEDSQESFKDEMLFIRESRYTGIEDLP